MKNRSTVFLDVKLSSNTSLIATILLLFFTSQLEAQSMTVKDNASVTVISGTNVFVKGALSVADNSSVIFNNNSNLIQTDKVPNSGNITIRRNSSALKRLDYTLWSSPVSGQSLFNFSPFTTTSRFYCYNSATNFYNQIASPSTTNFNEAQGYLIRMPNNHPTEATVWNGQFVGVPNNGDFTFTMYNGGSKLGYNLVGNPYCSPIDATAFVDANSNAITGTLYFWRKTNNPASPTYCTWSKGGFVTNGEEQVITPGSVIQTGQGFFVEAKNNATSLVFTNDLKVDNINNQFFRNSESLPIHRYWLNATNTAGLFSQLLVTYMNGATVDIDDGIDGLYMNDGAISFSSLINGKEYAIQGRSAIFDPLDMVQLEFKATTAGEYNIAIDHVEGLFASGQNIFLKDQLTGTYHNLSNSSYTFTSDAGTFNGRFEVGYQNLLSVAPSIFNANNVILFIQNNNININSGTTNMKSIRVYDIQGRLLLEKNNINTSVVAISELRANQQIVIVQITSHEDKAVVKKVVF